MTVFINNAEFTQRLQRENSELLAENRKLRKELAELQDKCKPPNLGEFFDWDKILAKTVMDENKAYVDSVIEADKLKGKE